MSASEVRLCDLVHVDFQQSFLWQIFIVPKLRQEEVPTVNNKKFEQSSWDARKPIAVPVRM